MTATSFGRSGNSEALYVRDLGDQGVDRVVDAALSGAHVLQRLKDTHNPQVLASYGPTGARRALDDEEGGPVVLAAMPVYLRGRR